MNRGIMRGMVLMFALLLCSGGTGLFAQYGFECTYVGRDNGYLEKAYKKGKKEMDPLMEMLTKKLAESKTIYKLVFSEGKVLFRAVHSEGVKMNSQTIFYDMNLQTKWTEETFMEKSFLVEEPLVQPEWEIREETRMIAGRLCSKAVLKGDTSNSLVAWFSPETPLPIGPAGLGGLPGIIVQLEMLMMTYTMQEDLKPLESAPELAPPTKGTKVTREEYLEIMKKKKGDAAVKSGFQENGVPSGGIQIQTIDIKL